jgi:2-keto-4-pentenoate hydratase/2-oxohepta-3-ene-1,7-dioic acid hydratase in catechol pathway
LLPLLVAASLAPSADATDSLKLARVEIGGRIQYAVIQGDRVHAVKDPFRESARSSRRPADARLSDVRLLVPVVPSKVLGVASNYWAPGADRATRPDAPQVFLKTPSALVPHEGRIVLPRDGTGAVYEGEMVVVIGRRARNVPVERSKEHILGVTCGNDVSGVGWKSDLQWWRSKGADTFAPCGPFVVTGIDYRDLAVELRRNGKREQFGRTKDMIFNVDELISFISRYLTLEPGDVIYSGTPGPIEPLQAGDVVEVEVEGVGVLRNIVAAPEEPSG